MFFLDSLGNLNGLKVLSGILDLLIVWYVLYLIINAIKGTKAIQLLKGILFILIGKYVSQLLGLTTTTRLFDFVLEWGFLAVIVIFQPELRRALEQLGRGSLFKRNSVQNINQSKLTDDMVKSVQYMAKRRIGALIVIEKSTGLQDYIETGIPIYANISSELLINIFIPNTPLHDGAMIIQGDKIATAASYLPLSDSAKIQKSLGTRHRAAVGISEVSDAFTIVVSEETGAISVTYNGRLRKEVSLEVFEALLTEHWFSSHLEKKGGDDNVRD
ncbi:diadenylate cyclase CdaA [Macrococcus carouselicus]|uniref:Diadenylate cyclase n=1 Tax=Macrococcus carouselicus TaxID=69969 RepID=A0A9Q8CKU4_9STAP|nr:diadenylate cyclase CdaA [Macrococcus carouselicus]TDL96648.1 TIGR00159 family protein [Macrococcus carouselicus]